MSAVGKWWSSIKIFPEWGYGLMSFMRGTIGATVGLFSEGSRPRVAWVNDVDTAYADQDRNIIGISSNILSDNRSLRFNPSASKEEAMGAILGFIAHEAAHFLFSPKTVDLLINRNEIPFNQFSAHVANVMEDIYIEKAIVKKDKSFGWMILAAWDYIFSDAELNKRLAKWDGQEGGEVSAVLDVMTVWKHRFFPFQMRSEYEQELYDLVMAVENMDSLEDRKAQIVKVYRFLFGDSQQEENNEDEQSQEGEGEGQEGGNSESESYGDEDSSKSGKSKATVKGEYPGEASEQEQKKLSRRMSVGNSEMAETNKRQELEIEFTKDYSNVVSSGDIQVRFINVKGQRGKLTYDKKWLGFGKFAQDSGTVRTVRGTAGNNGRLTHPQNLVHDGKVFSKLEVAAPNGYLGCGSPQTIILIDFSGSMCATLKDDDKTTKYKMALSVAAGALDGLTMAKHRVAIYGHTTDFGTCDVYEIKRFAETAETGHANLLNCVTSVNQSSNADHAAIDAVSKKFLPDGSPCRLLVISDGAPACEFYAGHRDGIDKTKNIVDSVRRRGVQVYSFSIDETAVKPNNEIYGDKFNFECLSADVVQQFMRKVV